MLIQQAQVHGTDLDVELIKAVVVESDKQRFALSEDSLRIRANQGHSVNVDLRLQPRTPPDTLYHGTATRFMDSINQQGLLSKQRHHVHLSADTETASKVGIRHGKLIMLAIDSRTMQQAGLIFYQSENGVWLTDHVPAKFINVIDN